MMCTLSWVVALATALAAATANAAQITYVDADFNSGGNTTATDGSTLLGLTVDGGSAGTGADGLWRLRTNLSGNGSSLYEANGDFTAGGNTENVPRALTTVTGLTPGGLYDIYGYFAGNHPDMRIGMSLTDDAGQLAVYTQADAAVLGSGVTQVLDADLAGFTNTVTNDNGFAANGFYQVALGQMVASGAGTIGVYADDDSTVDRSADGGSLRTVYEGVGYSLVPEPTSFGLALITGMALVAFRRRA
jgi:hypothetical protein